MSKKTAPIEELVSEVLGSLPKPYNEDIIEDVFIRIENDPILLPRYEELSSDLQQWVVNNWIGKYTKLITGLATGKQVDARRSRLTKSYSKLLP